MGVGYIPYMPVKYGVSLDNTILENLAILPTFANLYIDLGQDRGFG